MIKLTVHRESLEGGYSSNFSLQLGYVPLNDHVTVQGRTFREGDKVVVMTQAEYDALVGKHEEGT